jgi:pyrophosphatase PpaX
MKAVLWDLDDTVLDTLEPRMEALAHAHRVVVGTETDPRELWRQHRGATIEAVGRDLVGDDWPRFVGTFRDHYFGREVPVPVFDGVAAVLHDIVASGRSNAIVTAKVSWGATAELQRAGLLHYFAAIVGYDDTDAHKPDAEPVLAALQRLTIYDPDDAMMIGDTPADIGAAKAAGCRSVAALWGSIDRAAVLAMEPDHVAESPFDIAEIIGTEPLETRP